jgi:Ca2+-binding EF-hand superfamily protein
VRRARARHLALAGSLDVQELVAILSRGSGKDKLEGAAAEARAKEIIANFDLDQDGRLQMEEFVQWWKSERFKLKEDEEEAEA